jgi:hypothetical protein
MKTNINSILKSVFILGAILDGGNAVSWFLIASGIEIPSILSGYIGSGQDYQFAMYIAAMFMASWTIILGWGAFDPIKRRDLLLIAAIYLLLSVIIEFVFYSHILGGGLFIFGVSKRLFLVVLFSFVYFYSMKHNANNTGTQNV